MGNNRPTGHRAAAVLLWFASGSVMLVFLVLANFTSIVSANAMPWLSVALLGLSLFMLFYLLVTAVLAVFYRPAKKLSDEELPSCTVIVPAYNEGRHVAETLRSLLESDFPPGKMQILAVNDGSRDDTYAWILRAAEESGGRITPVNLPRNMGKKHALYRGILLAEYDIIVTVDSDSIVWRNSVRSIVSAFNRPDIGGVAGRIGIKNLGDGMIPMMMDIGFLFSFEILRSAQSVQGWVMCTPGALSAYRKSIISRFLDEWLHQTFLGVPARIGEDRAIATMILEHGYQVTFERDAVAATCIPPTYGKFCRMLLRWMRSDIRENWIILKYGLHRPQVGWFRWGCLILHIAAQIINTIVPALILPFMLGLVLFIPIDGLFWCLYSGVSLGMVSALIPAMIYARRISLLNSVWALVFAVYSVFALSWIALYSFLSLRNTDWLTRELPRKHCPDPISGNGIEKIS